jgi:DNA-binding NarL/FixJ family response regulator
MDLIRHAIGGHEMAEVARKMGVTLNTAKTHACALYKRLGVAGRPQAVARIHELWPELMEDIDAGMPRLRVHLSMLELEVVRRLGYGEQFKQMAKRIPGVTEDMLKWRAKNAYSTLQAANGTQAVHVSIRGKLIVANSGLPAIR